MTSVDNQGRDASLHRQFVDVIDVMTTNTQIHTFTHTHIYAHTHTNIHTFTHKHTLHTPS